MISCSSSSDDDEPAGEWQNWSTMNLCIALDQSNYETLKGVGSDIPVDFGSMRCYVDKQYYSISSYQNWVFYLQDGSFLFSNETLYFFEKDGMAYMLANGNESIYISKTLNDPLRKIAETEYILDCTIHLEEVVVAALLATRCTRL